jgi:hypothetical protein
LRHSLKIKAPAEWLRGYTLPGLCMLWLVSLWL